MFDGKIDSMRVYVTIKDAGELLHSFITQNKYLTIYSEKQITSSKDVAIMDNKWLNLPQKFEDLSAGQAASQWLKLSGPTRFTTQKQSHRGSWGITWRARSCQNSTE